MESLNAFSNLAADIEAGIAAATAKTGINLFKSEKVKIVACNFMIKKKEDYLFTSISKGWMKKRVIGKREKMERD